MLPVWVADKVLSHGVLLIRSLPCQEPWCLGSVETQYAHEPSTHWCVLSSTASSRGDTSTDTSGEQLGLPAHSTECHRPAASIQMYKINTWSFPYAIFGSISPSALTAHLASALLWVSLFVCPFFTFLLPQNQGTKDSVSWTIYVLGLWLVVPFGSFRRYGLAGTM